MNERKFAVEVDPREYLPRQTAGNAYRANGAIYLYKTDALRTDAYPNETKCYGYVMGKIPSIDIDDLEDFALAEAVINYMPEYQDYFA